MSARISTLALGAVCVACLLLPAPAIAARGLATGLLAGAPYYGADAGLAFERTRAAGATTVRVDVSWRDVAPGGATRPAGFDPTNPADPAYNWSAIDRLVQLAASNGLEPFLTIKDAPDWAERGSGGRAGTNNPDPGELGRFAQAAARRYSGGFAGLPRVRAWEVWSEVNGSFFFFPQKERGRIVSPDRYRRMVNEVADAVHGVAGNRVIAGGLFPFAVERPGTTAIGPLAFMRKLLCMTSKLRPRRRCPARVRFDVWSHHPYTSGGPAHKVSSPSSVSIAQLPRMRRLLSAALRHKRIVHRGAVRFWVTEFSWDSNPPDPGGVPSRLHARWTAEALYRMWRAGVSQVTWFQLRDEADVGRPHPQVFESGLYLRCSGGLACDTPKRALTAFRFPFVAFRAKKGRASIWGRTPGGVRTKVIVEQATRRGWRRLATVKANRRGIFQRRVRRQNRRPLRARLPDGATALPFSLHRPRDRTVNPFG